MIGDSCWHCHTGVDAFPLHIATKFKIPLLVYGESVAEGSGKASYLDKPDYSIDYFLKFSSLVKPDAMIDENITKQDLNFFNWPDNKELRDINVTRIHLSDFIYWDGERQTEFIKQTLGWKEDIVEGTYKRYKSVECIMPGVHDYLKYLKRGFGRATDFTNRDVREGLMTLDEASKVIKSHDPIRPKILDYYLKISGYSENELEKIIIKHRNKYSENLPAPSKLKKIKKTEINDTIKNIEKDLNQLKFWQNKIKKKNIKIVYPSLNSEKKATKEENIINFKISKNIEKKYSKFRSLDIINQIKFITKNYKNYLDIIKVHVDHINKVDQKYKIFEYLNEKQIISNASIIGKIINEQKFSIREGIPVSLKDIFNTADMPTKMGSNSWNNINSGFDSRVVFNLRNSNFLIVGKTATSEFAVDSLPKTKNVFDFGLYPGTSSTGSALSVATKSTAISLGTQTAGSTIRPASYNGIFAMKPSFGLIPRTGVLKTSDTLDTISFFGSNLLDLEFILDELRVKGNNYPYAHLVDIFKNEKINKNIKVLVPTTYLDDFVETDVLKIKETFIKKLKKIGIKIIFKDLNKEIRDIHNLHEKIYSKSLYYYFQEEFKNKKKIGSEVVNKIEKGSLISNDEYQECLKHQELLQKKLNKFLKEYDFVITHSVANSQIKSIQSEKNDYCLIWTFLGMPAINIPFRKKNGFPCGLQISSKKYHDYRILNFCKKLVKNKIIENKCIQPVN
tara:strand:- start:96 stop:2297 length:2202 start_codon:yes stop_codon:yes gene_type:complete